MQGQKSPVRTLSENFVFDNVSASNDAAIDSPMSWNVFHTPENRRSEHIIPSSDENVTYRQHARREGKNAEWAFGESSSSASQHHDDADERKLHHTWRTLCFREQPYEEQEQHYELSRIPPADAADLNARGDQRTNRTSVLETSIADTLPQDLNITAGLQNPKEDDCRIIDHRSAFRTIGSSNGRPNGRPSDSFEPLSGYGGFVMEEGIDGTGCSLDPRRTPCKRKAIEVQMGQASGVGSSNCTISAERSQWHAPQSAEVSANDISLSLPTDSDIVTNNGLDRVISRVRIGAGGSTPAGNLFLTASENADSSNRDSRFSTNGLHRHDSESGNPFVTETDVGGVNVSSSRHSSRLALRNYLLDLSQPPGLENGNVHGQSLFPDPPVRTSHQSRWSRASSRRTSSSSTSANSGGRNAGTLEDMTSRNASRSIAEHPMFVPSSDRGISVENPTNWDLASRNHSLGGNAGSTSRASSSAGAHSSPSWSYRSGSQYRQQLQDMIRRSLLLSGPESGGPSSNPALQASSSASQELAIPSGPDNNRHRALSSRSALLERHLETASGVPYSLRSLPAAGEGRRSVISEIRHVLDLMRRGESLRFEDMMILDPSVLFGMPDALDRHRDMRMDVDNMSYEELLALEERIGNVCTGLSEETIIIHLKKREFVENKGTDAVEKEPCSICREEYNAGDDLGELKCGHDFHTNCIKQWLMVKNLCPICKTAGLNT